MTQKEFLKYIIRKRVDVFTIILAIIAVSLMKRFNPVLFLFMTYAFYMLAITFMDLAKMEVRQVTGKVIKYNRVSAGKYLYRLSIDQAGKTKIFSLDSYRENCVGFEVTISYLRYTKTVVGISSSDRH